ncbi:MAG TPA: cyclodeaminase/cyclohydrolase family protein [bacterium]|jgi:formiminotetrahydrofolate cyclodeaminase
MLIENSLKDFIAQTASSSPAPGGGSASALAGALGTALAEMVINLTVGKKKYADVSEELAALLPKLSAIRQELCTAVDRDTEAFNEVMTARSLPKETEEQIKARQAAIQEATIGATRVPLSVMQASLMAMQMTLTVARKGNRNSISDAGVAALLLSSAIDGAALNVRINLPGLPDDLPFKKETTEKYQAIQETKNRLFAEIQKVTAESL